MAARFKVWIGDTPETTDFLSYRLVPVNCRRQDIGNGGAQFQILRSDQVEVPEEFDDSGGEIIRVNKVVRVEDSEHPGATVYNRTIWCGFITSIIKTPFQGTSDYIGTAYADEIGVYIDQFITDPRWMYQNEDDVFQLLQSPPDFNPLIRGQYYANKVEGTTFFKNFPVANTTSATIWDSELQDNVWTIYDIIDVVTLQIPNIVFTKPTSADANYIPYCDDTVNIRTFPAFLNMPLSQMLGELLPKPLTWRFDYQIDPVLSGSIELLIESESDVAVGEITPSTSIISELTLPNISGGPDHGIQSFTMNEVSIPTDQVVIRGQQILVCGSFTPWDALSKQTLEYGWTDAEEVSFEAALTVDGAVDWETNAHDEFRKSLPDVYQKFDFINNKTGGAGANNAKIYTTDVPGSTNATSGGPALYSFFPLFEFTETVDVSGSPVTNYLSTPLALKDLDVDVFHYSTPNALAMKWENELPVFRDYNFYDDNAAENKISSSEIRLNPMVWAPVRPDAAREFFWTNLLDTSLENKCQLDYHNNGFYVISQYPQYSAWNEPNDAIFTGEDENVYKDLVKTDLWDTDSVGKNPEDPDVQVNSKTHWSRFIFTVAGRSDQRLEYVRNRVPDEEVLKRKIIDTNYENWFVHGGTVINPYQNTDGSYSLLNRIPEDTWTKNEYPDMIKYGDAIFYWLSKERQAFTVEYQLMNYDYNVPNGLDRLQINTFVQTVLDKGNDEDVPENIWTTNTVIKSVEYIFNETTPLIIISSELPQEPLFTKLLGENNAE